METIEDLQEEIQEILETNIRAGYYNDEIDKSIEDSVEEIINLLRNNFMLFFQ